MRTLIFATALLAATPSQAQTPDAAAVVAAERAFAADAPAMGIGGSFNKWAAPDAVVIGPGGVQRVSDAYPPDAVRAPNEARLAWWPNFAGIARSGDLGFTTGGVAVAGRRSGHYFTVWKRQADGSWRWVYDGGSGASSADVPGPDSEPTILAPGPQLIPVWHEGASADPPASVWALNEVREQEVDLAAVATTGQAAAHLRFLADNGRLYVAPRPPAIGRDAFAEALAEWPATFRFGPTEGGGASIYGDMVWTYGPAAWTVNGQPREGHYVRMWQRQEGGWKIVLAQLIAAPPSQPPPPAT